MNCARLNQVLDAWLDGELDATTSADIRRHVDECAACAALERSRLALLESVRNGAPYYAAPPVLRERVREAIRFDGTPAIQRSRAPRWSHVTAIAACAALVSALATYWAMQPVTETRLSEQIVASHVASMAQSRPLVAVESGERHTVKPWFQGKVDFAPSVKDLSDAGFVLLGGRVDHAGERQAAAIVYRIREHVINLFVWRSQGDKEEPAAELRTRGFTIVNWTEDGLRYAAISDVDPRDLRRFAEHMRTR